MKKLILIFINLFIIPMVCFAQAISYPSEIDTDYKKLLAVYSIIEQMRFEHNRQGEIANNDWENNKGKWQEYQKLHKELLIPLLAEQNGLKEAIRKANYTDEEWSDINDKGGENQWIIYQQIFGDKEQLKKLSTQATSDLFVQLKAISLESLTGEIIDPYEDWTGYTETDPNSVLTVAANQITFTNIQRQSACTVYADKGASHFGATFQHLIDTRLTAQSGNDFDDMALFWGVANVTDPNYSTDPLITVYWTARPSTGNAHIYLMVDDGATDASDPTGQIALNTIFYLTIDKNATDTDCRIYSNASRTTLLDTLTVANGATAYQYMHNGFSRGGSTVGTMSGDIYNLDLQEAAPAATALSQVIFIN